MPRNLHVARDMDPHLALCQGVEPRLRRARLGRGRRAVDEVDGPSSFLVKLDTSILTQKLFLNGAVISFF